MTVSAYSLGILFVLLRLSRSLDYSDLEAVGVSCPERDSCSRIDGEGGPETRNCECDPDCWSYGDCCVDALYRRLRPSSGDKKEGVVCLNYGQDNHTGVYAVARCSSGWKGSRKVREMCEGSPSDVTDVPVTDVVQSVTYKNVFCARCNGVDTETLQAFRMRLACDGLGDAPSQSYLEDRLFYDKRLGAWGIDGSNVAFRPCDVTFDLPDPLKATVRFCRARLVSECSEDWTDRATRLRCGRYTAVVHDAHGTVYRNPHCALCNRRRPEEVTCGPFVGGRKWPFSFEFLLDPNQGGRLGKSLVDKSRLRQCPPLHVYDPFFERCRKLVCALPDHQLVGERCVPNNDTS